MLEVGKYDEKIQQGKENRESWGQSSFNFKKDGQGVSHKMVCDKKVNVLFQILVAAASLLMCKRRKTTKAKDKKIIEQILMLSEPIKHYCNIVFSSICDGTGKILKGGAVLQGLF